MFDEKVVQSDEGGSPRGLLLYLLDEGGELLLAAGEPPAARAFSLDRIAVVGDLAVTDDGNDLLLLLVVGDEPSAGPKGGVWRRLIAVVAVEDDADGTVVGLHIARVPADLAVLEQPLGLPVLPD